MILNETQCILVSILNKFPDISDNTLYFIFRLFSKGARYDRTRLQLERKKIVEPDTHSLYSKPKAQFLRKLPIDKKIVNEIQNGSISRLSFKSKSLLVILQETQQASLNFLCNIINDTPKNCSAILLRLEEKGLVYGYYSQIPRRSMDDRKYRPKYYSKTELGIAISELFYEKKLKEIQKRIHAVSNEEDKIVTSIHDVMK